MFQFPSLPPRILFYSDASTSALPLVGFPIRKSRDQRSVSTSPRLIAAAHVLHRLLAPRHPPCALILLIERTRVCRYGVFKVRSTRESRPRGRSLKTQQRATCNIEVNVYLGDSSDRTTEVIK